VQVKPLGHSVGVSVGTGIGAPCLTSTPIKRPRMEDTVFEESSTYTSNQCSDVTYEPDVTQESIEKVCQPLYKARKYMVYEENLLQLFRKCQACCHTCTVEKFVNGTFVSITQICSHCLQKTKWNSQPHIQSTPAGNLHLSAAVAFSGASYIQIHKVLTALCLECICPRTFFNHQKTFLQPTILSHWRTEQNTMLEMARHYGKAVVLGGDMRADSPGLAKKIDALGKERSCGEVLAWRRSIINHLYWCASSSKTGEEAVEKWKSVTNHVQNVHHHDSDLFPVCAHPPLEMRAWLTPSTKACERFCDLMINQRLLKDVAKLSPH
ncbi:hypothetical protein cypCar_00017264, partial [Cyprinus carpio]